MKYPLDDVICFCYKRAKLFRRSSVVEQLTVNQLVVGSSPTAGAIFYNPPPQKTMFKNTPLYDRLRIWNNLRIQNRRLSLPFRRAAEGFMFKGLDVQFTDAWESHERVLLQRLLPQTSRFINIGAHYGYYTCLARSLGLPVVALEPVNANFQMLVDNVDKNEFGAGATLIHAAAGAGSSVQTITGVFSGATLTDNSRKPRGLRQRTAVVALDDVVADKDSPSLILMDVEGAEYDALLGAQGFVTRLHDWVIEIMPYAVNRDNVCVENPHYFKVFQMMRDCGYDIWRIDGRFERITDAMLERMQGLPLGQRVFGNFLFVDKDKGLTMNDE